MYITFCHILIVIIVTFTYKFLTLDTIETFIIMDIVFGPLKIPTYLIHIRSANIFMIHVTYYLFYVCYSCYVNNCLV